MASHVIRQAVTMPIQYPLFIRNREELIYAQAVDSCHETVRFWPHRFAADERDNH